ncbi:MAG: AI-2E family transporter [Proteobacteria bacterium]|nr:AI-2E family transporter [Pseudomonadota bacterium]
MAEIIPPSTDSASDGDNPINRWPLVLASLLFFGLLFYLLQPILLPFVLGALIAYLGDPLVDALERRQVNRTLGVVLVFILFFTLVIAGVLFMVPLILDQLDALIRKIPAAYQWLTQVLAPWLQERLGLPEGTLPQMDWSSQLADNWQSLGKMMAQTGKKLTGSGAAILMGLASLALVPVVAFYLMRDWDILMDKMLRMMPMAWQERTSSIVGEADEVVGAFMRGQFIVMCALGVIYGTGLWMIGVQLALLLGLIAGLASLVPYLGFIVGVVSSLVAAYFQFHDWSVLLWVVVVFGVGQAVESMLLTPILVGDRIGLHPVAVIFALMAGSQIAGFIGIVVALPVAAVITVFARHGMDYYRASDIYWHEGDEDRRRGSE